MRPRILVVGAGAVGSYFAAKLSEAGAELALVCRSDYDAVRENGIRVESDKSRQLFIPDAVLRSADEYQGDPDYILVATKVLPGVDDAAMIAPAMKSPRSVAILIRNGIETEEHIHNTFPRNEILAGSTYIAASRPEPGLVRHQDYAALTIGRYPRGHSDAADVFANLIRKAGVDCRVSDDIGWNRWEKLLWNIPFNPMSVLAHADTKAMMDDPETAALAKSMMREVQKTARAAGHELADSDIENKIEFTSKMRPFRSSMLQDHDAGRPMETEAILGNFVRIARRLGVDVPKSEAVYALLRLKSSLEKA